ncbi:hypothetical protein HDU79_004516 [Rhizoclosmatium sp. JEL0117]|nr:hypothetical protein HDU79_004516 [Rhizoclosmatium sp. JEL0117]
MSLIGTTCTTFGAAQCINGVTLQCNYANATAGSPTWALWVNYCALPQTSGVVNPQTVNPGPLPTTAVVVPPPPATNTPTPWTSGFTNNPCQVFGSAQCVNGVTYQCAYQNTAPYNLVWWQWSNVCVLAQSSGIFLPQGVAPPVAPTGSVGPWINGFTNNACATFGSATCSNGATYQCAYRNTAPYDLVWWLWTNGCVLSQSTGIVYPPGVVAPPAVVPTAAPTPTATPAPWTSGFTNNACTVFGSAQCLNGVTYQCAYRNVAPFDLVWWQWAPSCVLAQSSGIVLPQGVQQPVQNPTATTAPWINGFTNNACSVFGSAQCVNGVTYQCAYRNVAPFDLVWWLWTTGCVLQQSSGIVVPPTVAPAAPTPAPTAAPTVNGFTNNACATFGSAQCLNGVTYQCAYRNVAPFDLVWWQWAPSCVLQQSSGIVYPQGVVPPSQPTASATVSPWVSGFTNNACTVFGSAQCLNGATYQCAYRNVAPFDLVWWLWTNGCVLQQSSGIVLPPGIAAVTQAPAAPTASASAASWTSGFTNIACQTFGSAQCLNGVTYQCAYQNTAPYALVWWQWAPSCVLAQSSGIVYPQGVVAPIAPTGSVGPWISGFTNNPCSVFGSATCLNGQTFQCAYQNTAPYNLVWWLWTNGCVLQQSSGIVYPPTIPSATPFVAKQRRARRA